MSRIYTLYGVVEGMEISITVPDDASTEEIYTVLDDLQEALNTFDTKEEFDKAIHAAMEKIGVKLERIH